MAYIVFKDFILTEEWLELLSRSFWYIINFCIKNNEGLELGA